MLFCISIRMNEKKPLWLGQIWLFARMVVTFSLTSEKAIPKNELSSLKTQQYSSRTQQNPSKEIYFISLNSLRSTPSVLITNSISNFFGSISSNKVINKLTYRQQRTQEIDAATNVCELLKLRNFDKLYFDIELICIDKRQQQVFFVINLSVKHIVRMQTIEQYEYRINLLDEYSQTLQRENQAKNSERQVIYQQMGNLQSQNDFLKGVIDQMKERMEKKERLRNVSCSLQTSINLNELCTSRQIGQDQIRYSVRLYDVQCQTQDGQERQNLEQLREVIRLNEKLREKDLKIENYLRENQQMYEAIEKLEEELTKMHEKNHAYEERARKITENNRHFEQQNLELRSQLEELNYKIYDSNEQTEHSKQVYGSQSRYLQVELQKMVKDNNQLIQRVRMLEKQKNGYYQELKKFSHLQRGSQNASSLGNQSQSSSKRKALKGDRWTMIEDKIKSIRSQNQKLQANMVIK